MNKLHVISHYLFALLFVMVAFYPALSQAKQADESSQVLYAEIKTESGFHLTKGLGPPGHEDEIRIAAIGTELTNPYDETTGQINGKTKAKPVAIIKDIGPVTPLLVSHLIQKTSDLQVIVSFWQPSKGEGILEHYFTVSLDGAAIVSVEASADGGSYEAISFIFAKMVLTDEINGIETTFNWSTPPA